MRTNHQDLWGWSLSPKKINYLIFWQIGFQVILLTISINIYARMLVKNILILELRWPKQIEEGFFRKTGRETSSKHLHICDISYLGILVCGLYQCNTWYFRHFPAWDTRVADRFSLTEKAPSWSMFGVYVCVASWLVIDRGRRWMFESLLLRCLFAL